MDAQPGIGELLAKVYLVGFPLASREATTVLTEQMAGLNDDALPLQRYTRPPEAGRTALGIAFNAAITDLGETSPCRPLVPTVSAFTLWNSTTPF